MAGVSISKANAYAAIAPLAGISISKAIAYAVVTGTPSGPPPAWLVIREPSLGYTDRTPYMHKADGNQNSWSGQLRQRGQATIHLYVAAGDTYKPTRGTPVYLFDQTAASGFIPVFAGLIQDIENQWLGTAGDHFVIVTAVGLESVFDTVYAKPVQYAAQTCGAIVTDLFTRFETGCPVTLGIVDAGTLIPLLNTNYEKISDLFDQLATTSGFTWGVDPVTLTLFFCAPSSLAAPWTVSNDDVQWESVTWKQSGADYRNRQAIRLNFEAFGQSGEFFVGTGQSAVLLARPVNQVTSAWATLSTCNTATGTFSGQPAAGDTVSINAPAGTWQALHVYGPNGILIDAGGHLQKITTAGTSGATIPTFNDVGGNTIDGTVIWNDRGTAGLATGDATYTFVTALDNRQYGQVLIGGSAAATCQNLADAINANDAVRGVTFSLPTWENALCNAILVSGASFTLQQKTTGTSWTSALSDTSANFSWSSPVTIGGTSPQGSLGPGYGATISLQTYVTGTSTAAPGVTYTPGSAQLNMATPLNAGSNLNVFYTRAGGDILEVEDTAAVAALAAITHGTGKYQQITGAATTGLITTSSASGLQFAQEALAAFGTAPQSVTFQTYVPGLQPGQTLAIAMTLPTGAVVQLNGDWVVEEISAELVQAMSTGTTPWLGTFGHYRYTVRLVNISEIGSYLDFWQGLGGGGGASGGGAGTGSSLVATSGASIVAPSGTVTSTGFLTAHTVIVGNGVADEKAIASPGTTGQFLKSLGAATDPAFLDFTAADLVLVPLYIGAALPGLPAAGQTVALLGLPVAGFFAANFTGSVGSVGTNPTATAVYTVKKNGSTIGTISISTGGVLTFATSGGTTQTFAANDRLSIIAPGPADATLADVEFILKGTRT